MVHDFDDNFVLPNKNWLGNTAGMGQDYDGFFDLSRRCVKDPTYFISMDQRVQLASSSNTERSYVSATNGTTAACFV